MAQNTLFSQHTIIPLALVCVGGLSIYTFLQTEYTLKKVERELASTTALLLTLSASSTEQVQTTNTRFNTLSDLLYNEQTRIDSITGDVSGVSRSVSKLSGSVDTLKKLTTTDPELLKKYSKIYFLNENYKPTGLSIVPEAYDFKNGKEATFLTDALPFLTKLLESAQKAGIHLQVLSGYRSFAEQTTLKQTYKSQFGQGANSFSADQGYSEHQLGTAVDFTTLEGGENLALFEKSVAFSWLTGNAYKYGFVLSYPKGNAYYQYEPWHWRFVGKSLAVDLHDDKKNFYDIEQRAIDAYIPTLFD